MNLAGCVSGALLNSKNFMAQVSGILSYEYNSLANARCEAATSECLHAGIAPLLNLLQHIQVES